MNIVSFTSRSQRGYSLIEMMIVISILGIIAGIAAVGFGGYIVQANRQDAVSLLSNTVLRLERCFTLEGTYNGACTLRTTSEEGYYSLVANRQTQTYTLTAVPVAGSRQENDTDCGSLSITATGEKNASGAKGPDCW